MANEVYQHGGEPWREADVIAVDDAGDRLDLILNFKGGTSPDELVRQHPGCPDIDGARERLDSLGIQRGPVDQRGFLELRGRVDEHLRGHVVQRPAAAEGDLLVPIHGEAKVSQAHATAAGQEDVLRLDVPEGVREEVCA